MMNAILSIQSHVVYGYVGNKAAVYPLQALGFDVWPINTVQFSNHTGYGKWRGEICSSNHIMDLVDGIFDIGQEHKCVAILSGYMGSREICETVFQVVQRFKSISAKVIYLCDPVIGNNSCYVKPEVLAFFKSKLLADIITPNQYEAEVLSGISISSRQDLENAAIYFHKLGTRVVVITGVKLTDTQGLWVFASDGKSCFIINTVEQGHTATVNGTGDLFSSLFLGTYLKHGSLSAALQHATFYVQQALEATIAHGVSELQVLSVNYTSVDTELLPQVEKWQLVQVS